ncbi:MAG: hypothetical protein AVDCRST_MAG27-286, partial [uncultured Craurococcus sp.]
CPPRASMPSARMLKAAASSPGRPWRFRPRFGELRSVRSVAPVARSPRGSSTRARWRASARGF